MVFKHGLCQHVLEPTTFNYPTNTSSVLDLIFSNDENFVHNVSVVCPFSSSDHCTVNFKILNTAENSIIVNASKSFDFKHADWQGISEYFNNSDLMSEINDCSDAACKVECFYRIINDCIVHNVPVIVSSTKVKYKSYPYFIRHRLKQKTTAWNVYKHFKTPESLAAYKKLASECRSLIYKHALYKERNVINSGNVSAFYRHCNRRFNCRSAIGPIKTVDGHLTCDPQVKANVFQDCFSSFYTIDNNVHPPVYLPTNVSSRLGNIVFTPGLINKAIKKLKANAKGGPDGIPPILFKNCQLWLSPVLCCLFQECFDAGCMPAVWSKAFVTPVYKKGDRSDASNYRPIALTCVICKLMESVIKEQLLSYLLIYKFISKHQHAFISKHSTTTNLLESTFDWALSLNNKQCTDIFLC